MKVLRIERYYSNDLKNWYKIEVGFQAQSDGNHKLEFEIPPGAIVCRECLSLKTIRK